MGSPWIGEWQPKEKARELATEAVSRQVLEQTRGHPGVNILREHVASIRRIDGGMDILISMIMEYGSDLFSQSVSVLRERARSGVFGPPSESFSVLRHLFGSARTRTASLAPPEYSTATSSPKPLEEQELRRVLGIRQLIDLIPGNSSIELEEAMESWRKGMKESPFRRRHASDLPSRPTADPDDDIGAANVDAPSYNPEEDIQAVIFDGNQVLEVDRVPVERLLDGDCLERDNSRGAAGFRLICLPANNMDVSRLVEFVPQPRLIMIGFPFQSLTRTTFTP